MTKEGDRVVLEHSSDPFCRAVSGTKGVVLHIGQEGILVAWVLDPPYISLLLEGEDRWKVERGVNA